MEAEFGEGDVRLCLCVNLRKQRVRAMRKEKATVIGGKMMLCCVVVVGGGAGGGARKRRGMVRSK